MLRRPKRQRSNNKSPNGLKQFTVEVDRQNAVEPSCPGRCDNMFRCMLQVD